MNINVRKATLEDVIMIPVVGKMEILKRYKQLFSDPAIDT